jgi:23S rRNA pseudouridine1911/1915/1917 synthase
MTLTKSRNGSILSTIGIMNLSENRTIIVSPDAAGQRLDIFLTGLLEDLSRSQIQKLIGCGKVLVNGNAPQKRYLVAENDAIMISETASVVEKSSLEPQDIPLAVLFEDDYLIAIDKPAGLVVHPGSGNRSGTLVNGLLFRAGDLSAGFAPDRPGIVHRLDKETSGVLLVAKTNEAHAALARAFASREVKKTYLGICFGTPAEESGTLDMALARSRREPVKRVVDKSGKASRTDYRVIAARSGISIVQFMPRTGRTHQIRVHCSVAGFPIVGDPLYGGGREQLLKIEPLARPFASAIVKCFDRHALHARSIGFSHPVSGVSMSIEAPLPADFQNAVRRFGDAGLPEKL